MSERTLTVLLPEQVDATWGSIRALLQPSVKFCNGEFEVDDLLDMVLDGRAFVLVLRGPQGYELAAVCESLKYPRRTVLHVLALGGSDFGAVTQEFWGKIVEVAAKLGATSVRGAVRPAMERYCKRVAPQATRAYVILERAI